MYIFAAGTCFTSLPSPWQQTHANSGWERVICLQTMIGSFALLSALSCNSKAPSHMRVSMFVWPDNLFGAHCPVTTLPCYACCRLHWVSWSVVRGLPHKCVCVRPRVSEYLFFDGHLFMIQHLPSTVFVGLGSLHLCLCMSMFVCLDRCLLQVPGLQHLHCIHRP